MGAGQGEPTTQAWGGQGTPRKGNGILAAGCPGLAEPQTQTWSFGPGSGSSWQAQTSMDPLPLLGGSEAAGNGSASAGHGAGPQPTERLRLSPTPGAATPAFSWVCSVALGEQILSEFPSFPIHIVEFISFTSRD